MDLSMTLPTMVPHGRSEVFEWCRRVDQGPWASLAVPERTTYTSHDFVVQLAAAAALTERVRLWTTIVVLPAHDAVDIAKKMASVDVLSGGRLTVGIGVGGRDHDYRALGASTDRRWARMDEQVASMQAVWRGEAPFDGADPVGPEPVQAGGPPLVAGSMGPKATRRAAEWATGVNGPWTISGDVATLTEGIELVRSSWADAGRTDAPHVSAGLWFALGDDPADQLHTYVYDYMTIMGEGLAGYVAGNSTCAGPDALRSTVEACAELGLDELFLVPTTADPDELDRAVNALGLT